MEAARWHNFEAKRVYEVGRFQMGMEIKGELVG